MHIDSVMLLFPIVFMVHEFEEILFVSSWVARNKSTPHLNKQYWVVLFTKYSVSATVFAALIAEEFVVMSALTLAAVGWNAYALFTGLLIAYAIHLLVYIGAMLRWRCYVPGGPSALLTLPVIVWMIGVLLGQTAIQLWQVLGWTVALGIGLVANLRIFYRLSSLIERIVRL
jgi:hypothetical protein